MEVTDGWKITFWRSTIMAAFLSDPTTQPDTSCIASTYDFAAPHRVSVANADATASMAVTLPAIFPGTPSAPGQYVGPQGAAILIVAPAGATPDDTLTGLLAQIGVQSPTISDGPTIAGLPSRTVRTDVETAPGQTQGIDAFAFADDSGTYMLVADITTPSLIEPFRQTELPAMLDSITLGGS
jgi:hypothetical protein